MISHETFILEVILKLFWSKKYRVLEVEFINLGMGHGEPGGAGVPFNGYFISIGKSLAEIKLTLIARISVKRCILCNLILNKTSNNF